MELDQYEKEILNIAIHPESFDQILEEFSGDAFILGDCLRSLARKKLLFILEREENAEGWKRRVIYDADKLPSYRYQLSAKGLELRDSM